MPRIDLTEVLADTEVLTAAELADLQREAEVWAERFSNTEPADWLADLEG